MLKYIHDISFTCLAKVCFALMVLACLVSCSSGYSEKDGKKIVDLMTKLGAATTKAAEASEDKDADKFKLLGKALSGAAKAIKKFA